MKDFFEELGKYIGETATTVGNKAGEVIETQKLKAQVRSLTHENTVDLLELGRGVYEQYKSGAVLDEKVEGYTCYYFPKESVEPITLSRFSYNSIPLSF